MAGNLNPTDIPFFQKLPPQSQGHENEKERQCQHLKFYFQEHQYG